ncbi:hypothetical protein POM88_047334 [Heracleum sosnowskyi]|uniref:Uncharacterized protein n=1 Tax=Heracleum sosnowskyi TaxID=360622 RepID=A0AAD8LZE4_9APIA|nr:hypothetical protein POM88_047334 [Heracleum sosnowskyi]
MNWKNLHGLVDISPFLLFESTGDSEKDCEINMYSVDNDNMEVSCDNEVDDAQSCCSDSSEIFKNDRGDCFKEYLNGKKSDQERMHGHEYSPKCRNPNEFDEDEDDDDDGAINQYCRSSKKGFVFSRSQKKSKQGCVDSKMEPIKKEEKDKLFWDTCLAS